MVFNPPLLLDPALHSPRAVKEPELLEWRIPNWTGVSESLEPIRDYCMLSAELPGIRPLHCSFVITLDLIQVSLGWSWDMDIRPDLGIRYRSMDELNQWAV